MRISDWSSDVCSSDLVARRPGGKAPFEQGARGGIAHRRRRRSGQHHHQPAPLALGGADEVVTRLAGIDRKSVVEGKSVSVRVDLGGRRIIKKKNNKVEYTSRDT